MSPLGKRIAPGAYQALRDAMPSIFWCGKPVEALSGAAHQFRRGLGASAGVD